MFEFLKRLGGRLAQKSPREIASDAGIRDLPRAELTRRLPFETFPVAGSSAVEAVKKLHRTRPQTHAFMIGDPEDFGLFCEFLEGGTHAEATFKAAKERTLESWLEARRKDYKETEELHGDWYEDAVPSEGFGLGLDTRGNELPEVMVGHSPAPTARWWETFAHTRFGGWNDCPPPDVHMQFGERWAKSHGAVLISHGYATLEYEIARPVKKRDEALRLAELHYQYCPDNILQGSGTFEDYAAHLVDSTTWAFWWD